MGWWRMGFADLVIEASLQPYDYCAVIPVIEGAGGMMTDWQGKALTIESDGRVVAAGDRAAHARRAQGAGRITAPFKPNSAVNSGHKAVITGRRGFKPRRFFNSLWAAEQGVRDAGKDLATDAGRELSGAPALPVQAQNASATASPCMAI